ncbi:MAG: alpha/beta hydrolase-fold protein [bacterium]
MPRRTLPLIILLLPLLLLSSCAEPGATSLRFEVSFPESLREGPLTGRAFVMISREETPEPRLQVGRYGVPFFGVDIEGLEPGETAVIDAGTLGSPLESLSDLPAGDYHVQALFNIYSRFERADGHVVWMHDDRWEGQDWRRSPGNLVSEVRTIHLDPRRTGRVHLEVERELPPVEVPEDTRYVKRFKFQSPMLSAFWGRPIYLGATVLLPEGYEEHPDARYPTIYYQGHFSLRPPFGFVDPAEHPDRAGSLSRAWAGEGFPRVITVTFQHPTPYFDDSYAVNSVNVGPYGDAIMEELIPEFERRFRAIQAPWARVLTGGSTGGWESLALQVWHPGFFGGTWSFAPDPVDFRNVEGIDIYEDENAFYKIHEWRKVPIANTRTTEGEVLLTSRQRNYYELVKGTRGRSGEQLDIWSAVFGPLGEDGYFQPLFDKRTGEMDPEVAAYWKEHYDIRHYLESNWSEVGPDLVGKIHIIAGHMDNFYLNVGCYHLQDFLENTRDPHYQGSFTFGARGGHGWRPWSSEELVRIMADHMMGNAPEGTRHRWRY